MGKRHQIIVLRQWCKICIPPRKSGEKLSDFGFEDVMTFVSLSFFQLNQPFIIDIHSPVWICNIWTWIYHIRITSFWNFIKFPIFLKSGKFENLILYPFVSTGTTDEKMALQTISTGFLTIISWNYLLLYRIWRYIGSILNRILLVDIWIGKPCLRFIILYLFLHGRSEQGVCFQDMDLPHIVNSPYE